MSEKIKIFRTIHLAICAGVILVYLFVGNIALNALKIPAFDGASALYFIVPVVAFGLGNFLFQSQLKQIDPKQKLEDSLGMYQTASLIRWAIIEGAAFFILFSNPDFVILGILLIAYLIYLRPTEASIKRDLQYLD